MGLKYSQTLLHLQNSILLYSIYAIFFQLVIDGLYINDPFPEQYLVRHTHQLAFHVGLKLGYKLYSIDRKFLLVASPLSPAYYI